MRIWSKFVIKVICIYIADIFHSSLSPLWDYTHIFLDIQIHCKLLMYWAGFCSHDTYTKHPTLCLNQEWQTFLTHFWFYSFPFPCLFLCPWQTLLVDHISFLLLSVDVASELFHLNSFGQAYRFTVCESMANRIYKASGFWAIFVVCLCIPNICPGNWQTEVKQSMFVTLMKECYTCRILAVIRLYSD